MEGILVYNYSGRSAPDEFYKVWFRNPKASFYLQDRTTWLSKSGDFFHQEEFNVGGPKCLITW